MQARPPLLRCMPSQMNYVDNTGGMRCDSGPGNAHDGQQAVFTAPVFPTESQPRCRDEDSMPGWQAYSRDPFGRLVALCTAAVHPGRAK